jgi:hypothetical protein
MPKDADTFRSNQLRVDSIRTQYHLKDQRDISECKSGVVHLPNKRAEDLV